MALLTSVLTALAPYLVDLVINIIKAEADPKLDTGFKKHDKVIGQLANDIKNDATFVTIENRHIMDAANHTIKETVSKLNEKGVFKKEK